MPLLSPFLLKAFDKIHCEILGILWSKKEEHVLKSNYKTVRLDMTEVNIEEKRAQEIQKTHRGKEI